MTIPTLESIQSLDGRIFAMLSGEEQAVFDFYYTRGRKFGVAMSLIDETGQALVVRAASQQEAHRILKSANSRVAVTIGADAKAARSEHA
jgi:hypothetical protein